MSTQIRATLSKKNKYYIPKERYLELVHWCRQYDSWKFDHAMLAFGGVKAKVYSEKMQYTWYYHSEVEDAAMAIVSLDIKMNKIKKACEEADPDLQYYILDAVTHGTTYTKMKTQMDIPCSRNTFYDRYHKFFWLLDKTRDTGIN